MRTKVRQREFGFVNWGGKRRGAGRKPKGERAGVSHAKRARLPARFPVLVTLRVRDGLRTLRARDAHALIRAAIAAASGERFRVVEYSVQANHLHALVEAHDERALSGGVNGLAVRIARAINRLWRRSGQLFADRFHARILETPRAVRTALVYVLQNARKHGAWRANAPDVFSSAPWFDGGRAGSKRVPIRDRGRSSGRGRGCSRSGGGGMD
jgi:REP element-mobilizing transposase RayT